MKRPVNSYDESSVQRPTDFVSEAEIDVAAATLDSKRRVNRKPDGQIMSCTSCNRLREHMRSQRADPGLVTALGARGSREGTTERTGITIGDSYSSTSRAPAAVKPASEYPAPRSRGHMRRRALCSKVPTLHLSAKQKRQAAVASCQIGGGSSTGKLTGKSRDGNRPCLRPQLALPLHHGTLSTLRPLVSKPPQRGLPVGLCALLCSASSPCFPRSLRVSTQQVGNPGHMRI